MPEDEGRPRLNPLSPAPARARAGLLLNAAAVVATVCVAFLEPLISTSGVVLVTADPPSPTSGRPPE